MDPHCQVSNKETFCPRQGKGAAIFTADLSPAPRPASTRTYVLAVSGRQARGFPSLSAK